MRDLFCGWYVKCQNEQGTLAVIPAIHQKDGIQTGSIQLITEDGAFFVPFSCEELRGSIKKYGFAVGANLFLRQGIRLDIRMPGLCVQGKLTFGPLLPLRSDIMGPFAWVPGMECRHSVVSMKHTVDGKMVLNDKKWIFSGGTGYIEGDRGRSFLEYYAWTQCSFREGSLMAAAAKIPLAGWWFTGTIAAVWWRGKEYRLATYLGASVENVEHGRMQIRQGKYRLTVQLLHARKFPLAAPVGGQMLRTIHESASCKVWYQFLEGENVLFDVVSDRAAFEFEYPENE